jgi:hypothetical protein
VVLVCEAIRRFTGFRIASISQFAVTMSGMVAAPLQFIADRSFAGAGKAFNQIVSNADLLEDAAGVSLPRCRPNRRNSPNAFTMRFSTFGQRDGSLALLIWESTL